VKQAETQLKSAEGAVTARLPETYQWLMVPQQASPQSMVEWQAYKLTGQDPLAIRASKKLRNDSLLYVSLAGSMLRLEMDKVPLWRGDHVAIKQLAEDCAKYPYLPRFVEPAVLLQSISDGLALLTWSKDSFAYAESFDEGTGRYRGLRAGLQIPINDHAAPGLIVKPDIAVKQMANERAAAPGEPVQPGMPAEDGTATPTPVTTSNATSTAVKPTRFHGSVQLDAMRVGRDAGRIAEEIIAHLTTLAGSEVAVTLEIEAKVSAGVPDNVVRTVTENSRTLKFSVSSGFESE
jgi:hypothetical protein